ncbi:MAG TPA: CopL family metal-binding regulatory protein [Xanthomonadaceae bacterium]|jgi:hypothetical protein
MSLPSVLLRILLCLSLLLNGVAAAGPMGDMHPFAHAGKAASAVRDSHPLATMPCHHHADPAHHDAAMAMRMSARTAGHPLPDCCKGATCHCACTQVAQAGFPSLEIEPIVLVQPDLPMIAASHLSPVLGHLIRPPIA